MEHYGEAVGRARPNRDYLSTARPIGDMVNPHNLASPQLSLLPEGVSPLQNGGAAGPALPFYPSPINDFGAVLAPPLASPLANVTNHAKTPSRTPELQKAAAVGCSPLLRVTTTQRRQALFFRCERPDSSSSRCIECAPHAPEEDSHQIDCSERASQCPAREPRKKTSYFESIARHPDRGT